MSATIRHWNGEEEKRLNIVRACFFVDCGQGFDQRCVGWANADSINAKRDYIYYYGLARLVAAIGIDNEDDIWAFRTWWPDHGAAVQNLYANYRWCGGENITFAEWVRDAFLDWLEPMAEDDRAAQEEYNYNYPQGWLVMGEERAARVRLLGKVQSESGSVLDVGRIEYTGGEYPAFAALSSLDRLNQEVIKWIGR